MLGCGNVVPWRGGRNWSCKKITVKDGAVRWYVYGQEVRWEYLVEEGKQEGLRGGTLSGLGASDGMNGTFLWKNEAMGGFLGPWWWVDSDGGGNSGTINECHLTKRYSWLMIRSVRNHTF